MINKELQEVVSLKSFSEFDRKFSNSNTYWLRDLYIMPTQPLLFSTETSKIKHLIKLNKLTTWTARVSL